MGVSTSKSSKYTQVDPSIPREARGNTPVKTPKIKKRKDPYIDAEGLKYMFRKPPY
jgi:hypothetical protein